MNIKKPTVDYRKLRFGNLTSETYRHLLLLLFWPIYGLLFLTVERFYKLPADRYYQMYCKFDDLIPFCEWFVIPYFFWFIYLVGMHVYTLWYDVDAFKRMTKYIMITYSVTIFIYFVFPNEQCLRPNVFARDNLLTRFIGHFYQFDTNTNVCPSIHVIGSLAVMEAALWAESIKSKKIKISFVIAAILICISTLFMKQHSILDILAALPLCAVAHFLCFKKKSKTKK